MRFIYADLFKIYLSEAKRHTKREGGGKEGDLLVHFQVHPAVVAASGYIGKQDDTSDLPHQWQESHHLGYLMGTSQSPHEQDAGIRKWNQR